MRPIIKVENLSKQYQLGARQKGYATLRESLVRATRRPLMMLRGRSAPQSNLIWALKDVSFEVKPGEVVGIIGRNGAGKSTLLKILSRITQPTTGTVDLYGRIGSLLEVGTGFHFELTGRENIYLSGAILGLKHAEITRKFDEIVAFAEIEEFIDTPVKRYSTGMYLRLAFAVAAHLEPEVMVLDEVLAVGDAAFQKKCLGQMGNAAQQGRTVLFVSHNLNAIEQLCSSVLLLDQGRVMAYSRDVRAVIKRHLFAEEQMAPSEWASDGSDLDTIWFKPRRFFISDEHGAKCHMPIANDSDVWIQIEAEIEQNDTALTVGYAIYSEEGHLLYWSLNTDEHPTKWARIKKGFCKLKTRLPQRLLNEGAYRLELAASLHHRQWLVEPGVNSPSINLIIKGGLSDSPHWIAKRPGILAPVLEWQSADSH